MNTSLTSSRVASRLKFTVFETALWVYFWKAACILTCHSGVISWAVTNTRFTSSGTSGMPCTVPCSAIRSMSSSLQKPLASAVRLNLGLTSTSFLLSSTFRVKAMLNSGSIPDEAPTIMLMVPVGAIVVVVALRSLMPWLA